MEMKTLIVYSSLSGNTKKVVDAVSQVLPSCEVFPVENAPSSVEDYDLVAVGYWASKGMPDAKTSQWLKGISNGRLAFFGTLGAKPDSEHARSCMTKAEEMVLEPKRGNTVYGSWMCQGRIDPKVIEVMRKLDLDVHRPMLADPSRFEEAARHPDANDCLSAQNFFRKILADMDSPAPGSVSGVR